MTRELHFVFWFIVKDSGLDGESFIEMDLLDINTLTSKVKLRKLLRLAWTEVTGIVSIFFAFSLRCKGKSYLLSNGHGLVLGPWTGIQELMVI